MALPSYNLTVITPQGVAFEGEVTHSRVPVEQGTIGVLANHAPLVTSSSGGTLEIRDTSGVEKNFSVGNGFFEVNHNKATFLTQSFTDSEV